MSDFFSQFKQAFTDFFTSPTRKGLAEILRFNSGEQDHLDFKREFISGDKLSRHFLAMANSGGGAIVFGVEEQPDGALLSVGLPDTKDASYFQQITKTYVPDTLKFQSHRFAFDPTDVPELAGKSFQILIVEGDDSHLPFISQNSGKDIQEGFVYVRRGTESQRASHTQLQSLINARIATGHSTAREVTLEQHFDELQMLYSLIPAHVRKPTELGFALNLQLKAASLVFATDEPNPEFPTETFPAFVRRAIELKKKVILGLLSSRMSSSW